ncbi:MAG: peptidase M14 [Planctomycetes bacterium]|nr:peptidase M14 [Planctomycetota bacterium]
MSPTTNWRLFPSTTMLASTLFLTGSIAAAAGAQDAAKPPKVDIAWNRFYDCAGLEGHLRRIQQAYPDLCTLSSIGKSYEGRPMWVMTIQNSKTGKEMEKPAIWIDGNVHGNEVQGGEACVYLAWYLTEGYDNNPRIRELLDRCVFYVLPSQNPDGRDYWFHAPNTASSSRSGKKPTDNDGDGLFDEDGPDDLDGDGELVSMRKYVPGRGNYRIDPDDPRRMIRVTDGKPGDWVMLGSEGIDNDGDGSVNEDGPGGYDMNRNWPSDWQPNYIQFGAGEYPFSFPETRAIGEFFLSHPNIAAVQSFHNAGGMILRGPGASYVPEYPSRDLGVFDDLGLQGEKMLPFYRYMVIHKDLYTVHGGFVNWAYEGLGAFAITNEMWAGDQMFQNNQARRGPAFGGSGGPGGFSLADIEDGPTRGRPAGLEDPTLQDNYVFDALVMAGASFVPWHKVQHPLYGEVELGGFRKMTGRVPPSFMIEEMLHRNALFCVYQAELLPQVIVEETKVERLGDGASAVTVTLKNLRRMPTRAALASQKKMGLPDLLTIAGDGVTVVAGGIASDPFRKNEVSLVEREPARLLLDDGVGSFGRLTVRWIVRGKGNATIRFESEKCAPLTAAVTIS